jgi:glycosyltransferase involved in cell wall biosynthesis
VPGVCGNVKIALSERVPIVSVVVPVLDEQDAVARLIEQVTRLETPWPWEVLFIDGGSRDATFDLVARSRDTVIRPPLRQSGAGLAAAWREGIACARGALVVTMDGDGAHSLTSVVALVSKAQAGADLVIARRYGPSGSGMPGRKLTDRWASRAAAAAWRARFGLEVHDPMHGFRVRSRRLIEAVHPSLCRTNGNVWMGCETLAAARGGFAIDEVTITYGRRTHGNEHKSLAREGLRFGWRLVASGTSGLLR